ncbi:MAG TPA: hypothetical protein VEC12_07565 [Bacteroidia bacterium]|nr:hypothetical protein [Bacteroidia bacterium]
MRNPHFIALHRGGLLTKEQHIQLMLWACACVEHLLPQLGIETGECITNVLKVGRAWAEGKATVGDARRASVQCVAAAKEATNPVAVAIIRAAGHAVATAHMADHSLGPALYGLKALKLTGKPVEPERAWQNAQLPSGIKEMVKEERAKKEKHFKL